MSAPENQDSHTINCSGLSTALTLLRIKQAITAPARALATLSVSVDPGCDCQRVCNCLGEHAKRVRFSVVGAP